MISDWFFQAYAVGTFEVILSIVGRAGFGVAILLFAILVTYNLRTDSTNEPIKEALAISLCVWLLLFFAAMLVPGAVGGFLWLFFL